MRRFNLGFLLAFFFLSGCGQDRNVEFFKETEAYELARAIADNDTSLIEKLVKEKPSLLKVTAYKTGSDALDLALYLENYEAFKKLLDLGADPNFINPLTKRTPLIEACRFYEKPETYTIELKYIQLLLERGADPNYAVDSNFLNYKGHGQLATSPLHEASSISLDMVKLLIKYGGDPFRKLKSTKESSFGTAMSSGRLNIIYYYIDTLKANVHEPMYVHSETGEKLYIQQYIKTFMGFKEGTPQAEKKQLLIKKLEGMGVDFKNYKYRE